VDAAFAPQVAVPVRAGDDDGRALQARLFARRHVDDLSAVAVGLGPAKIHAQQHLGPVLGFRAAGAGVHREDGVACIVFARKQRRQFEAIEPPADGFQLALNIGERRRVLTRGELRELA